MVHIWQCPLCEPEFGRFERLTKIGIETAIASHIMNHVNEASLKAVNDARLKCQEITCSLGKTRALNTDTGVFEPKLTEYDIKFLNGCKIKVG